MKRISLVYVAVLLITSLFYQTPLLAQIIVVPDTLNGWDQTWFLNINGSQSQFNNWSEGGVNTVGGTASTVYTRVYRKDRFTYGYRANLRYGQSKINGQVVRKTDDLISLRTRSTYDLNRDTPLAFFAAIHFRTQFDEGYDYGKAVAGGDSLTSTWFAPAYFTESMGLDLKPNEKFNAEIGLALKQTIVTDSRLQDRYGIPEGESIQAEGGLSIGLQYENDIMENLSYVTSIETFTNLFIPISQTDVFWSNQFRGKINSLLSAILTFELRYDYDYSKELQLKQVFAAGLSVKLHK